MIATAAWVLLEWVPRQVVGHVLFLAFAFVERCLAFVMRLVERCCVFALWFLPPCRGAHRWVPCGVGDVPTRVCVWCGRHAAPAGECGDCDAGLDSPR